MKKILVIPAAIVGLIAVAMAAAWIFWPFGITIKEAVRSGNITYVRKFLESGGYVNRKDEQSDFSVGGTTLLMHAAMNGQLEIAKYLIEHGADINAVNNRLDTALSQAAFWGHQDIMQLLIDHGVYVKHQWKHALLEAVRSSFASEDRLIEAIKLLLQHGADVNYVTKRGESALYNALMRKRDKMAKFLIEHGADTATAKGKLIESNERLETCQADWCLRAKDSRERALEFLADLEKK